MKTLPLANVRQGSILACNVYSRGKTIYRKGYALLQKDLRYLKAAGVRTLLIADENDDEFIFTGTITEKTRNEAAKTVETVLQDYENLTPKKHEKIRNVASKMVDEIIASKDLKIQTHDLRTYDDYTYRHSVNVTAIAIAIGRLMYFEKSDLRLLAEAGLVHDIGKMKIPNTILNKEGPLDGEERDVVQNHPTWGFNLLREKTSTSPVIWGLARQHHETLDGKGYPDKRAGDDIHPWARILAVADIWDALRSDRSYKKGWPADKVLKLLNSEKFSHKLDRNIINIINDIAVHYPTGSTVRLSNGMIGIVVQQNSEFSNSPVVKITIDDDGKKVDKEYLLDISKVSFVEITETIV